MAEFSEVMRQWSRMCSAMLGQEGKCEDCGLWKTYRACGGVPSAATSEDFAEVERVVMAWAAEHPEPVYPTWAEWLMTIGVISGLFPNGAIDALGNLKNPIPADIAEKLGIEPKDGGLWEQGVK